MKNHTVLFAALSVIIGAITFTACKKSNDSSGSGSKINKADLMATWSRKYYVEGTDSSDNGYLRDSLRFTSDGKAIGIWYDETYTTSGAVWVMATDTGTYNFVNDSTIYLDGRGYLYRVIGDTFRIRKLDAHLLDLRPIYDNVVSEDYDIFIK